MDNSSFSGSLFHATYDEGFDKRGFLKLPVAQPGLRTDEVKSQRLPYTVGTVVGILFTCVLIIIFGPMAKYGKAAVRKIAKVMRERKKGTLKSGRSGKKVTSRKQAIAIGISEARKSGAKVPAKKTGRKTSRKMGRKTARKTARKSRSRS